LLFFVRLLETPTVEHVGSTIQFVFRFMIIDQLAIISKIKHRSIYFYTRTYIQKN